MSTRNLAPIFKKPTDALTQGTWKIFPEELFIFTASNIEHRSKIAGFDLGFVRFFCLTKFIYYRWNFD